MSSLSSAFRRTFTALAGPVLLIAAMIWMLHRALFSGGRQVPTWPDTDIFTAYIPWRYFGFHQWSHGHFPWWNPHVFCGLPFFAQVQTCLFYPIAWVHFLFNTGSAVTLEMALNLAAGAVCMYVWARGRGISRCASVLAGMIFPLSAPIYLFILDGYLTMLSTAAWMPLVFLAIDWLLAERFVSGILIGGVAVCLQCLGGHVQLAYYTFLGAGLYLLLESWRRPRVVRIYSAFLALWLMGAMLAAIQLLPSYLANQNSIRAGGVSYAFSGMESFPPENLLTLFIPYPFGGMTGVPYMGRWLLWGSSLYAGLIACVLACIGLAGLKRSTRRSMLLLLGVILILSLGAHTPVHWLLYKYLPLYNLFREPSKFATLWPLWVAVLAGHGWDRLRLGEISPRAIWLTAVGAAVCILLAFVAYHFNSPNGPLGQFNRMVIKSNAFCISTKMIADPLNMDSIRKWMAVQWCLAAVLLAATSLLIYLRHFSVRPAYILLALALAEICIAAAGSNTLSEVQQPFPRQWAGAVVRAAEHDQRLLLSNGVTDANLGNMLGFDSLWGYDTGQPRRYTQLMAASQGEHPGWGDQYIFDIRQASRIFQLLRCRYILLWNGQYPVREVRDPMPHLQLIGKYVRMNTPAKIADRLAKDFDFYHSAILEADPHPAPTAPGAAGHASILHQSINDLEIEADLPAPALLLVTDAYAPGWRAVSIDPNPPQPIYPVLRADDVLRAIPLSAGHHHFDLYYIAPGFTSGAILSLSAIVIYLAIFVTRRRRSVA